MTLPFLSSYLTNIYVVLAMCQAVFQHFANIIKNIFIFDFRERGREGEKEGEKHQCVVASHMPPYWGHGP